MLATGPKGVVATGPKGVLPIGDKHVLTLGHYLNWAVAPQLLQKGQAIFWLELFWHLRNLYNFVKKYICEAKASAE